MDSQGVFPQFKHKEQCFRTCAYIKKVQTFDYSGQSRMKIPELELSLKYQIKYESAFKEYQMV